MIYTRSERQLKVTGMTSAREEMLFLYSERNESAN